VPLFWDKLLGYQQDRVLAFLDPSADPTGAGWHTQQSIFAVGSGRLTGKGFLEATQNHFNFLPEHWTDFPFSVWAEEWGFIGSVALILIFGFLILWTVNVALQARDRFGTAICLGMAARRRQHRDGHRPGPRGRRDPAVHLLRRLVHDHVLRRPRPGVLGVPAPKRLLTGAVRRVTARLRTRARRCTRYRRRW
jgi:hypothetical protein